MQPVNSGRRNLIAAATVEALLSLLPAGCARREPVPSVREFDSCRIDPDGTAHVTRVVPVPGTISPEAQKFISRPGPSGPPPSLTEQRAHTDAFRIRRAAEARERFPVNVIGATIGGVRCDIIKPLKTPPAKVKQVLINVHGGGSSRTQVRSSRAFRWHI